jgi:hypothetical protein
LFGGGSSAAREGSWRQADIDVKRRPASRMATLGRRVRIGRAVCVVFMIDLDSKVAFR